MIHKLLALIISLMILGNETFAQPDQFKSYVQDYLSAFPENTEVAIGILDKTEIIKLGYRIENGVAVPIQNSSTLFEIGSISKTFVAALLMKEVEHGTMALDDPVREHLASTIAQDTYKGQTLRLLHLATHTSGLKKNPLTSYKRYSNYLSKFDLNYVPGQQWEYNNMAVSLLAELIAEENGSNWSTTLQKNLLQPLGMDHTYSNVKEVPEDGRVQCTKKNGSVGDCYFHNMGSFHWSSGGMISNIDDMVKWLNVNMNDDELSFIRNSHNPLGDTISIQWFTHHRPTQGIIWWHYRGDSGNRIIGHAGEMPQQSSFMAMDKEKKRGIIILTNTKSSETFVNPETPEMSDKKILLAFGVLDL